MTLSINAFTAEKAGMSGVNKTRVKDVIDSCTSSNFRHHSDKQTDRVNARIRRNDERLANMTEEEIEQATVEMDRFIEKIEETRDLSRVKIHIDMDSFYASVEMRDDPLLRSIPMGVGTDMMLSTANYVARKFGVRSAMPGFIAKRLCPELKIIPGNYTKYRDESDIIKTVFHSYDPHFRAVGWDEAYLDITDYVNARKEPVDRKRVRYRGECICRLPLMSDKDTVNKDVVEVEEQCLKCGKTRIRVEDTVTFGKNIDDIVHEIRFQIEQISGLTCSAGIAVNWMIAKICSDWNKPNGQFFVKNKRDDIINFMKDLPVRKVSGIGGVTEAILNSISVYTCGDIYEKRGIIKMLFTEVSWSWFMHIAIGVSMHGAKEETENYQHRRKSIGIERTFGPTRDMTILLDTLHYLCNDLIESLVECSTYGGHVATLTIKWENFDRITRSRTANYRIDHIDNFYPMMERILKQEMKKGLKARLIGVRLSKLDFTRDADPIKRKSQKSLHDYLVPKKRASTSTTNDESDDLFSDQSILPSDSELENLGMSTLNKKDINICCPICGRRFSSGENGTINAHIDECLNVEVINVMKQKPAENIQPIDRVDSSSNVKKSAKPKNTKPRKNKIAKTITKQTGVKPLTSYFTANLNI